MFGDCRNAVVCLKGSVTQTTSPATTRKSKKQGIHSFRLEKEKKGDAQRHKLPRKRTESQVRSPDLGIGSSKEFSRRKRADSQVLSPGL